MTPEFSFRNIVKAAVDLLFPLECLACGKEGVRCCAGCLAGVRLMEPFLCPGCGEMLAAFGRCGRRRCRSALEGLAAAAPYADPLVRRLLHDWKYLNERSAEPAVETLVRRWAERRAGIFPAQAVTMPVPLHEERFRERGFNQAEMIARWLSRSAGLPFDARRLRRVRRTRQQAQAGREEAEERRRNVRGAFSASSSVRGGTCLLVDDVWTTGATMRECAFALRAAGASRVYGFVLAASLKKTFGS